MCPKSPDRPLVDRLIAKAGVGHAPSEHPLKFVPNAARHGALVYRTDGNSRELCATAGMEP